ncbi:hypothetical protein GCM10009433_08010 [Psychroflexus lacisalsi]|jgi:hypothetical protein|uniref:Uncharacterized protein n=1 Tax=Psychroflexus lacisalsi TaxID=503928 RepID=A0ABN1K4I3_9FLAO
MINELREFLVLNLELLRKYKGRLSSDSFSEILNSDQTEVFFIILRNQNFIC